MTRKFLYILTLLFLYLVTTPGHVFSQVPIPSGFKNLLPIAQKESPYFKPPSYKVTNILFAPADTEADPVYPKLIKDAVNRVQDWYAQQLDGKTFQINEDNNPIIIKSEKRLYELCNPPTAQPGKFYPCIQSAIEEVERKIQYPSEGVVLNIFLVGIPSSDTAPAGNYSWVKKLSAGGSFYGESILRMLKGAQTRKDEVICGAKYGASCDPELAIGIVAHEMGHAFGLSGSSEWSYSHPCTEISREECNKNLDPKFYPDVSEWFSSVMGTGFYKGLNRTWLNDSCINPERTLLKHYPLFGGSGYEKLNFKECLKGIGETTETIKILSIESEDKIFPGDPINIKITGVINDDLKNLRVIFPPTIDGLRTDMLKTEQDGVILRTIVPFEAFSGDVFIEVVRDQNKKIRSAPYRIEIFSNNPRINNFEPSSARAGDTITIHGENFRDLRNIELTQAKIKLGDTLIQDFIEYTPTLIRFLVPENASLGPQIVAFEAIGVDKTTQLLKRYSSISGPQRIDIKGDFDIEATLKTNASSYMIGDLVTLNAMIKGVNPKSAEIYIRGLHNLTPCDTKEVDNWCLVSQKEFDSSLKSYNLTATYTASREGDYMVVVNATDKNGTKCSGDSSRLINWIDCGINSRLTVWVDTPRIKVNYYIAENKASFPLTLKPVICEINNNRESCGEPSFQRTEIPSSVIGGYQFYLAENPIGRELERNKSYKISCYITNSRGMLLGTCPGRFASPGDTVSFNLELNEEGRIKSGGSFISSPISTPSASASSSSVPIPVPPQDKTISRKEISSILINGQRLGFGGTSVSIRLPDIVARGATHPVPITIKYSNKESFSRNLIFRYKLAGTQESGEKALPGEECDPQRFSCFATAERSDNNPELLFCRNMGESTNNKYEWVTQKFTTDICQGKPGMTATCGDGQGGETKYWCTGETWVDQTRWALIQKQKEEERQKQALQTTSIETITPQGTTGEPSCSLSALPERIKTGENITWVIQSNFKGISAQWGKDKRGEINPSPVTSFTNTNYWSETYPYKEAGGYTQYATVKTENGRECITNTVEVVVEKRELAEAITAPVQNITAGPKTISRIILTIPPYGQQRVINQGEPIRFSLPDTGGVPQTIQLPITIIYSDGSTGNKTISFAYKGNTCALSGGKCANSNGQTRDGYQCSTYRSDLTGCSIEKDNVYPHCYISCSKSPSENTTTTTSTPSQSTQTQNLNCAANGGVCADSAGITADQTKKCSLESYRSDYTGCSQYYYCYTSCSPNQTPALPQTGTAAANCSGAGEFCADSAGTPKDPNIQCNASKAYRNNAQKDQWCQGGEPGWYCWLCQ